jgi:hypothetical protein
MADPFHAPDLPRLAERVERSVWLSIGHKVVTIVGIPLGGFVLAQAYSAWTAQTALLTEIRLDMRQIRTELVAIDAENDRQEKHLGYIDEWAARDRDLQEIRTRVAELERALRIPR